MLHCFVDDLYDGQRMRPEKLAAWQALRERYGNRDESRVDRGRLLAQPEPSRSPVLRWRAAHRHTGGHGPMTWRTSC